MENIKRIGRPKKLDSKRQKVKIELYVISVIKNIRDIMHIIIETLI